MNIVNGWLLVVTVPFGVARAMQLAMNDKLLDRPRKWVTAHSRVLKASLSCVWCTTLQIALVTMALLAWEFTARLTAWLLAAGTVSILAVVIDRVMDRTPVLADNMDTTPPPGVVAAFEAARQIESKD